MRAVLSLGCSAIFMTLTACGSSVATGGGGHGGGGTTTATISGTGGNGAVGLCATDADCGFRESGCCGVCANMTDTLPPPLDCGVPCDVVLPCRCVAGHCAETALPPGSDCDPLADMCGPGTRCCNTCCGPDGGAPGDPMPKCVDALGGVCPSF